MCERIDRDYPYEMKQQEDLFSSLEQARCLLIVSSPFQALCAIEAIHHFRIKQFLFILCYSNSARFKQLEALMKSRNLEYKVFSPCTRFQSVELFRAFCPQKTDFNFAFCGNFTDNIQRMIAIKFLRRHSCIAFLDDGNNTMSLLQRKNVIKRDPFKQWILNTCGCLRHLTFSNAFFTMYSDVASVEYQCVTNNFESFTQKKDSQEKALQKVYIVGTNIHMYCRKLKLQEAEYKTFLKDLCSYIKRHYPTEDIVYIPHGRDSTTIGQDVCNEEGIIYQPANISVELHLLESSGYPKAIYAYTSTALLNLKKIFPKTTVINVCCHQIRESAFSDEYELFSEYFDKHGILRLNQEEIS